MKLKVIRDKQMSELYQPLYLQNNKRQMGEYYRYIIAGAEPMAIRHHGELFDTPIRSIEIIEIRHRSDGTIHEVSLGTKQVKEIDVNEPGYALNWYSVYYLRPYWR